MYLNILYLCLVYLLGLEVHHCIFVLQILFPLSETTSNNTVHPQTPDLNYRSNSVHLQPSPSQRIDTRINEQQYKCIVHCKLEYNLL